MKTPGAPPTALDPAGPRLGYLEGLRGLAAMQVVLLHYLSALLPAVVFLGPGAALVGWQGALARPPLSFLFDGSGAVCLFFLLSGAVLSLSFAAQPRAMAANALRRTVRLGVPAAAALILSFLALAAMPRAHRQAARLTGSTVFLGANMDSPLTARFLAQEVGLDSMIAGYSDFTPFRLLWRWQRPVQRSLDPPVWTLHLEFYGSLLVLLLVRAKAASRAAHAAMTLGAVWLLVSNPLVLFVIGHLAAPLLRAPRWARWTARPAASAVGVALIVGGIALSVAGPLEGLTALQRIADRAATFRLLTAYGYTLQHMAGESMIFLGVLASAALQRALGGRLLRRLGRLSFSIYLLHFPILFTVVSVAIVRLPPGLGLPARLLTASAGGLALTLVLAILFERLVDRPATALSRKLGGRCAAGGIVAAISLARRARRQAAPRPGAR